MKLWRVEQPLEHPGRYVIKVDETVIAAFHSLEITQEIADDHNAWVILAQRGWTVEKHVKTGKFFVYYFSADAPGLSSHPLELAGYERYKQYDTPQAAILAADAWLRERGQ